MSKNQKQTVKTSKIEAITINSNLITKTEKDMKTIETEQTENANIEAIETANVEHQITEDVESLFMQNYKTYRKNVELLNLIEDYNLLPIEDKKQVLQASHDVQTYLENANKNMLEINKNMAHEIKLNKTQISSNKDRIKDLGEKYGSIKKPTRKDFCMFMFNNWNTPQNVLKHALSADFYGFDAKNIVKTNITIVDTIGGTDKTVKFASFIAENPMEVATTKTGMKVYKLVTPFLQFTARDYEEYFLNLRTLSETANEPNEPTMEAQGGLEVVEVDF